MSVIRTCAVSNLVLLATAFDINGLALCNFATVLRQAIFAKFEQVIRFHIHLGCRSNILVTYDSSQISQCYPSQSLSCGWPTLLWHSIHLFLILKLCYSKLSANSQEKGSSPQKQV
ncbi:uncharacterized protein LACBIDRAFT_318932 [Laccaria bicolor S238N-H82]|uniref:Predicted protein n=1 Tax=Laccaria bicolor (strain S238N-H82 / ATCC MYA-4686) TaxID=486041 RepID=B0D7G7_LACBS|nr:uncharacterized protein LACBIDRAFT_318932 [Laccaria bicolor S238N-H82]EDR09649.1 predicted protein [Laccaria bicolor S238N-H82]|eukprot:XP_001879998.1 predicted protein [Laccaria bicolor S238N-H82]